MLAYELYTFNKKKGYEFIGVLPERRKNPMRITKDSIMNWGKSLLADNVDSKNMFFKQVAIDKLSGKILWVDLPFDNNRINIKKISKHSIEFDTRTLKDRRKQPTPAISRFTLWGRRKTFQRKVDQKKGGYVDCYHPGLLIPLTLTVGLSVLDALFTMMILDDGGWEINPVVRFLIQLYGDRFWVWKFVIVSFPLTLLCLHSKFRLVIPVILGITAMSTIVILYQIFLFLY